MKTLAIIGILLLILFIAGCNSGQTNVTGGDEIPKDDSIGNNEDTSGGLPPNEGTTLNELATHNNENDCWVAYKNKVYDITEWLEKHPGGKNAILPYCGTSEEFTNAFEGKHGESKVSTLMQEGILIGDFNGS